MADLTVSSAIDDFMQAANAGAARTALGLGTIATAAAPSGTVVGTSDSQTLTNKTLTSPVINTGVSGTAILDEDNMASDSATQLATQQSIKAYADTKQGKGEVLYEEIWIDAGAMAARTTNGAAASTEEYATNDVMLDQYLFDSTTEEGVQFKLAMPDSWDRSTIKAKFFWGAASGASAADGVAWGIAARAVSGDDAIDAAFPASTDVTDAVIAVGDVHVTAATGAITVSGTPALGDLILFEVTRVVGDASDDMSEDAKLLGVQIQYGRIISNSSAW